MDTNKISASLAKNINQASPNTNLEAILEIGPISSLPDPALSQQERISSLKSSFQKVSGPIAQIITRNGGKIINQAWINKTMRVQVSSNCLKELSDMDQVSALDVPHILTSDYKD